MAKGSVGMVQRITGPVVDILFEPFEIPDIFFFLGIYLGVELLGRMVTLYLTF